MLARFDPRLDEIDGHTFYVPPLAPGSIVLDLGAAGAGFSRRLAGQYSCRCFAAEPLPDAYRQIPQDSRLRAFPVAISGSNGPVRLLDRATHHGSASYYSYAGVPEKGTLAVDSVTIEGFLALAGVERADLVKLDIEGAEFDALEATSDDTLRRIGQLTVEFHDFLDPGLSPRCATAIARLEALGFAAIRFSRRFHGDVLFLNRHVLDVSAAELAWFRHVARPVRGVGRMLTRRLTGS